MKISEFATMNNVTAKMLRHYDEIGLLKPKAIDILTGYRIYDAEQSQYLSWILILKNLDFSLSQIQQMLSSTINYEKFMEELKLKRIEISLSLNEQIQKKLQIDKLIKFIEKEGFQMQNQINLLDFDKENVNELKKNMPHMEEFLEAIENILSLSQENDNVSILRLDISHFKQVNDDFGYDVGDKVILACYNIIHDVKSRHDCKGTIGRLGGDEFAIFTLANIAEANEIAKEIISLMKEFNFAALGCNKQISCYIGVLTRKGQDMKTIRKMLDDTIETLNKARENGPNSIFIEDCN